MASAPPVCVPFQPTWGWKTQREKPPLTTYERFPWPGWIVRSSGHPSTPIDLPAIWALAATPVWMLVSELYVWFLSQASDMSC